jgi:hypothetical protein
MFAETQQTFDQESKNILWDPKRGINIEEYEPELQKKKQVIQELEESDKEDPKVIIDALWKQVELIEVDSREQLSREIEKRLYKSKSEIIRFHTSNNQCLQFQMLENWWWVGFGLPEDPAMGMMFERKDGLWDIRCENIHNENLIQGDCYGSFDYCFDWIMNLCFHKK